MIDHICIGVSDYERSLEFYVRVLETLDFDLVMEVEGNAGFGPTADKPEFWISADQEPSPQVHFCFRTKTRAAVRDFHAAALAAGATEDWPPGIVEEYHPSYYATFVYDPDGYKIEALCLKGE